LAEKGTANVEEIQCAEHATNRTSTERERSPQTVDIKIRQKREFASNKSATSKPFLQKQEFTSNKSAIETKIEIGQKQVPLRKHAEIPTEN
jgi:hypothetical protein